jgi:hypothetical protein
VLSRASSADAVLVTVLRRLPLTLRALVLVPLLAVGVDVARATLACGPRAESCLEAAGRGWLGPAGIALLVLYAAALGLGMTRLAGGGGAGGAPPLARAWAAGTAGVAAACGGQALLAGAMADSAALGGGWAVLPLLCVVAGGVIAVALRAAPAAAAVLRGLRPAAPRLSAAAALLLPVPPAPARRHRAPLALAGAGRAPPTTG